MIMVLLNSTVALVVGDVFTRVVLSSFADAPADYARHVKHLPGLIGVPLHEKRIDITLSNMRRTSVRCSQVWISFSFAFMVFSPFFKKIIVANTPQGMNLFV